jgi:hypothetical protein
MTGRPRRRQIVILKYILEKSDGMVLTGFIRLKKGTCGGLLGTGQ